MTDIDDIPCHINNPAPNNMKSDIYELDNKLIITVEIPGFREQETNVKLVGRFLSIESTLKNEIVPQANYYLKERSKEVFNRTFSIPEGFEDRFLSTNNNGVITITIKRSEKK